MRAPSFRCTERPEDGALVLHYYSDRPGLEHIVIGIVKTVASKLHGTEVEVEIIRTKADCDHVQFLITEQADQRKPGDASQLTQEVDELNSGTWCNAATRCNAVQRATNGRLGNMMLLDTRHGACEVGHRAVPHHTAVEPVAYPAPHRGKVGHPAITNAPVRGGTARWPTSQASRSASLLMAVLGRSFVAAFPPRHASHALGSTRTDKQGRRVDRQCPSRLVCRAPREPSHLQPRLPVPRHVLPGPGGGADGPRRVQGDPRPAQGGLPADRRPGAGKGRNGSE